jgi:site-specific recombinase XerD
MSCQECRRPQIYLRELCSRCYNREANRRLLDQVEAQFRPLTPYNEFIFKKYLESIRSRVVTGDDLSLARRFVKHLNSDPIRKLKSWVDVVTVSKELNIRNKRPGNMTGHCPVMRVGRALERAGLIVPRPKTKYIERSHQFRKLSDAFKPLVEQYYNEISKTNSSARYGYSTLGCISNWEKFLGETPIFEASPQMALEFLETTSTTAVSGITLQMRVMRRFYDWLIIKGFIQVNPFFRVTPQKLRRTCSKCSKNQIFKYVSHLCNACFHDKRGRSRLNLLEAQSQNLSPYNRDLFKLYLRYTRRYQIDSRHLSLSKRFFEFLQIYEVPVLRSWAAVLKLSEKFKEFKPAPRSLRCPAISIGWVLQELGVLPIREDEGAPLEKRLMSLSKELALVFTAYAHFLRKRKRKEKTIDVAFERILHFYQWLNAARASDLWLVTEQAAITYIASIPNTNSGDLVRLQINKFYNWAKYEKYTLSNPFEKIPRLHLAKSHLVCSPEQILKLEAFIKKSESDPKLALILALIFYWGFTGRDLATATVEFENYQIKVVLHPRSPRCNQRSRNRNQLVILPRDPLWFRDLQKRFTASWHEHFKKISADIPRQPLILDGLIRHNRPISRGKIVAFVAKATTLATGIRIPTPVLRRSGADVYSKHGAAAILPSLGWSKSQAFTFTWRPRELYRLKK